MKTKRFTEEQIIEILRLHAAGGGDAGQRGTEGYRIGKVLKPAARRRAVDHARVAHGPGQRRACRLIGMDMSSYRYRSRRPDDGALRERLRTLAAQRRRFGYRRPGWMLEREETKVNLKRSIGSTGKRAWR